MWPELRAIQGVNVGRARAMRANNCEWVLVDRTENYWRGACGDRLAQFKFGGPAVNAWRTCPFCGGFLVEKETPP